MRKVGQSGGSREMMIHARAQVQGGGGGKVRYDMAIKNGRSISGPKCQKSYESHFFKQFQAAESVLCTRIELH